MKIIRKIPSVILAVVLLTVLAVFSVSAAVDVNSIEGNTVEVRSWVQLENALTKAPIGNNGLRNNNRYIVLNAHLTMTSEDRDVGIKVNYPGTIYLDLNGYSLEVNSSTTQNLFTIDGTQKTVFIIADTATDKTKPSSITFNSTKNESAVVYVNNPNASFRIFGRGDFISEKVYNDYYNTERLPLTNIFVNKASNFQTDTKPHAAIRADKIDVLTINETFFGNYSKNPVNMYIGECKKVKITDETIFKLSGKSLVKNPTYANIYLASTTKHPSEYFNIENGWVLAGESVKSILTKNEAFHPHFYDIIGEKSTSTAIPYKKSVFEFSVKYIDGENYAISLSRWQDYIDESKVLYVNSYCCYSESAEAKVERTSEIHHFGHMSFCANCSRLISITPHDTKTRTAVGYAPTCTKPGMKDKYKCKNCNLFRGGAEIPALGHDPIVDVAAKAPTCTEAGSTEGSHCSRCDYKVEAKVIPALGHTDADNDGKCDRCGEKPSESVDPSKPDSSNCSCNCHKKGIAKFFFKIILFFQKIFKQNQICKCGAWHY